MFVFTMLYCLFIAALYPGSDVVLDASFPDLCRLSYFVIACWERAELLSLLCVMFSSVFVIWCLGSGVVLPDLCLLSYSVQYVNLKFILVNLKFLDVI